MSVTSCGSGPVIVSAYRYPITPPIVNTSSVINSVHTSRSLLKTSRSSSSREGEGGKVMRRVHSAQPHSSSSSLINHEDKKEPIDLPRRKRVQSAVETRQVVNVSLGNTPYGSTVWGQTSYRNDYEKRKPIPLPKVRPASATRMNNPHPSHMFLQWRIPTRIHKHDRALEPGPDLLADVREDFYKDYSSNVRPGDDKCEVPITNVATIPFPGNKKIEKNDLKLDGKCITLTARGSGSLPLDKDSQVLRDVLCPPSYAAIKDWSVNANDKEREVFEKMIRATHVKDKDTKKVLAKVFHPDSMKSIQEWLQTIDSEEHEIALTVLQDLAMRSQKYYQSHHHSKHTPRCKRMHTWPKRRLTNNDHSCHSTTSSSSSRSSVGRGLGIQGVSVLRPHSACSHCSQNDIGAVYNKHIKREKAKTWQPEVGLWHHKIKPPQKSRMLNGGSLFCRPQQARGQHFAHHPEWPIA